MREKRIIKCSYKMLLSVFLCIGFVALLCGTAYARFQDTLEGDITFQVQATEELEILTGDWVEITSSGEQNICRQMDVSVTNLAKELGFSCTVRLATTLGISPQEAEVSLLVTDDEGNETKYQAEAIEIKEGSELYQSMGPGYVYQFIDSSGTELAWQLAYGQTQVITFEITGAESIGMTEVIVTGTQIKE